MKFAAAVAVFASTLGATEGHTDATSAFEAWKVLHSKTYASAAEESRRFAIFSGHAERVFAAAETSAFSQGLVWEMLDRTPEELAAVRGYAWSADENVRPTPSGNTARIAAMGSIPDSLDWRDTKAVSVVKQQGQGSSCWSFSSAGAIEGAVAVKHKTPAVSLSNQQIMDCSGVDCLDAINGTMTKAFHNIMDWGGGVDTFKSYGYRDMNCVSWDALCNPSMLDPRCAYWSPPHKCQHNHTSVANVTSYKHTLVGNETDLLLALLGGPIAVAMDASQGSFSSYTSGVYSSPRCQSDKDGLDHAVLLVGYGVEPPRSGVTPTPYWLVKNSWGSGWGIDGFFKILRSETESGNMCGLATDASYPQVA